MSTTAQSPIYLDRANGIAGVRTTYVKPRLGHSWEFSVKDHAKHSSICLARCKTEKGVDGCDVAQVSPTIQRNTQTGKDDVAMQCISVSGGPKTEKSTYQFKFGAPMIGTLPWVESTTIKNGTAAAKGCFDECDSLPGCWAANYFGGNATCVQFNAKQTTADQWWVWELNPSVTIPSNITFGDLPHVLKSSAAALAAQVSSAGVHEGTAVVQLAIVNVSTDLPDTLPMAKLAPGCDLAQVSSVVERNCNSGTDEGAMQGVFAASGYRGDNATYQFKYICRCQGREAAVDRFARCQERDRGGQGFTTNHTEGGQSWVWELNPNLTIPSTTVFGDLEIELKSGYSAVAALVSLAGNPGVQEGMVAVQLAMGRPML
ncbi:hypothetical protein BCR44DRAFT_47695 [Catenaria anguillulae PL171]|uniref:Apple domain-containing protein n=1 Tax=Catenaria anguillulae PL171 TaxID=765915 RepID=A0A1Y2HKT6_9FUNG|nr:hypothetical protein BCR44DRAFT_47695 [Catenaria anguillulae PL171]